MDVLRAQRHSLKGLYHIRGDTALIDATMRAINDLKLVPQFGGDHAFLIYVVTDGQENVSRLYDAEALAATIGTLPDNWTVAALVPNVLAVRDARKYGFPQGNIAVWDTLSATGVEEAGAAIADSFDNFTAMRSGGGTNSRSTKQLFAPSPSKINDDAVAKLGMIPVKPTTYDLIHVGNVAEKTRMIQYFADQGLRWRLGQNFYQLQKDELIAADKELALVKTSNSSQVVYIGPQIRTLLGLPDDKKVRVAPGLVPGWQVYVQSKSADRYVQSGGLLIRKA
jgi:hypothetical protein